MHDSKDCTHLLVVSDDCVSECQKRKHRRSTWVDYLFKAYWPNELESDRNWEKVEERCKVFAYLYDTNGIKTYFSKEQLLFLTKSFIQYLMLRNNTNHAHGIGIDKEECRKQLSMVMDTLLGGIPVK